MKFSLTLAEKPEGDVVVSYNVTKDLLLFSRGLARRVFPLFFSITLIFLRTPYSTSSTSTTQRTRSISIAS